MVLKISNTVSLSEREIEFYPIRAQGAGGQNVNKVSSAVQLRFDISNSSLPEAYKQRLFRLSDHRITKNKIIVIKAQRFRTQEKNKEDAIERLLELIKVSTVRHKKRIATAPSLRSKIRRTDSKIRRGKTKSLRMKVTRED